MPSRAFFRALGQRPRLDRLSGKSPFDGTLDREDPIIDSPYLLALGSALAALLAAAVIAWLVSLIKGEVSFVDSLWSLFFILTAAVYLYNFAGDARALWVTALVTIWGLRLSGYIGWRNWGRGEDARYKQIRDNNEPGFRFKSLYIVFGLQAVIAWLVSLPLLAAIGGDAPLGWLDAAAALLWLLGLVFEAGGDYQLTRFRADPANRDKVLDTGLWRYTRHPNYFGDFCVWWSFYLFALSAGGWWALPGPLLMSVLLLKVSGVALTEKTIGERRPQYAEYVRRTNAFFPGPRR